MTQAELIVLLKQKCESCMKQIDETERWKLDPDFRNCAIDCWVILTGNKPAHKTDGMTWVEMKHFNHKCTERVEELQSKITEFWFKLKMQMSIRNALKPSALMNMMKPALNTSNNMMAINSQETLASEADQQVPKQNLKKPPSSLDVASTIGSTDRL